MSFRWWSACQRATGSPPARRTARAASTSSREPGKVMIPMRMRVRSVVREVQLDVLDDGVGQQRLGDLLQLGLVGRALDVEDEVLALAHAAHAVVAEPAERAEHRLTLGVGDLRLQDDVDDHPRHADETTWRPRRLLVRREGSGEPAAGELL